MTIGKITFTDGTSVAQEINKGDFITGHEVKRNMTEEEITEFFDDLTKAQLFGNWRLHLPTGEFKQIKSIEVISETPDPEEKPHKSRLNFIEELQVSRAKNEIRREELLEEKRSIPYPLFFLASPILFLLAMMRR